MKTKDLHILHNNLSFGERFNTFALDLLLVLSIMFALTFILY